MALFCILNNFIRSYNFNLMTEINNNNINLYIKNNNNK